VSEVTTPSQNEALRPWETEEFSSRLKGLSKVRHDGGRLERVLAQISDLDDRGRGSSTQRRAQSRRQDRRADLDVGDLPAADRLTIQVLAAVAEHEREMISFRTKTADGAAKKRGVRFGNPYGARALRAAGKRNAASAGPRLCRGPSQPVV
jgi:hypothetical protein